VTDDRRFRHLVDVLAGAEIAIFTFGMALPGRDLGPRPFVAQLALWMLFVFAVGLVWWLDRLVQRTVVGPFTTLSLVLELPVLLAMLLFTLPARSALDLVHWGRGDLRQPLLAEVGSLSILTGVALSALSLQLLLDVRGRAPWRPAGQRQLHDGRRRALAAAGILALLSGPILGVSRGTAATVWIGFAVGLAVARGRLLARHPQLRDELDRG